jgi:hypothetical protein
MKRIVLITALLLTSAATAYADTSHWTSKQPRSDEQLYAAGQVCDQRFGTEAQGIPTSAQYKRCMAGQGWAYQYTTRDDTWVNHRGMTCHSILNGLGSECSSF